MQYYDKIAKSYNYLYKEEQLKKLNIIKYNIQIGGSIRILDIGCGTGISSDFECFVVGIDPSIELLKQNNKKKVLGISESLPFKDRSFEYIVSITSIHNFKNVAKSLHEAKRVGMENFIFSVLRKSKKYDFIKSIIEKNFKIEKAIEDEKDMIFFCKNR